VRWGRFAVAAGCGLLVSAGLFGGPVRAGTAVSAWTITPSPNAEGNNYLDGVSCASSSFCVAVGYSGFSQEPSLVETWNGSSWTIVPSPNPLGFDFAVLNGVSCVSSSFCVAVGYYYAGVAEETLVETWNGSSWNITPSPNPTGFNSTILFGVSCASPSFCQAVGEYDPDGSSEVTLIESWNGSSWTVTPTPIARVARGNNYLNGVSCVSSNFCMAVGATPGNETVTWDGTSWSVTGNPSRYGGALTGVSCTSASFCAAVGWNRSGVLAELYEGTQWKVSSAPIPPGSNGSYFYAVTCSSPSLCVAAGDFLNQNSQGQGFVESYNGSSWSVAPNQIPAASHGNHFYAASCPTSLFCVAVGYNTTDTYVYPNGWVNQTLVDTAKGSVDFVQQPPAVVIPGSNFTVKVSINDIAGNIVGSDNTTPVTLAITPGTGPQGAKLTCNTNPVTASGGYATFTCSINMVGSNYSLTSTATHLTPGTSKTFTN
jgi:hypothetical protein